VIAKGGDFNRMMAELFGKATGYCKGKGGSQHIADFSIGMLGCWAPAALSVVASPSPWAPV
jgi:TPP-dependent pyruvate/acetoin dehydrogenase alpha subunit